MSSNASSIRESAYIGNSSPPPPLNQIALSTEQTTSQSQPNPVLIWLKVRYNHVLFDRSNKCAFQLWWKRTPYGRQVMARDPDLPDPDWGSAHHRLKAWENFIEAANFTSGKPCLFCCQRGKLLKHPLKNDTSAGNLKNHLKTRSCIDGATEKLLLELGSRMSGQVNVVVFSVQCGVCVSH